MKFFIPFFVLIVTMACSPKIKDCIIQDKDIGLFKDEIFERPFPSTGFEFCAQRRLDTLSNPERNLLTVFIDSSECLHINRVINKSFKNKEDLFEYFITNPDKRDDFPDRPGSSMIVFYSSKYANYERHQTFTDNIREILTNLYDKHLNRSRDFDIYYFFWSITRPYPKNKRWAKPCIYDNQNASLFLDEYKDKDNPQQYQMDPLLQVLKDTIPSRNLITIYIDTLACLHINKELPNTLQTYKDLFEYLLLNPDKRDDLPKNPKEIFIIVYHSKFLDYDTYSFFLYDFFVSELFGTHFNIFGMSHEANFLFYPTSIYPKNKR